MAATTLQEKLDGLSAELAKATPPPFGHACKKLYSFDDDYVNLNNGSFGTCPNHVLEAYKHYLAESERRPDIWMRTGFKPLLERSRKELAQLVNCPVEDLVLLTNATTGVNAILRGMAGTWSATKREAILVYDTVYGACGRTAQYIVDSHPSLQLSVVKRTRETLDQAKRDGVRVRVAILDTISSLPGVVVPWQQTVQLLREHDVLSLVDGAHAVGQIPLNLRDADPDFFVSNCHKWLSAHRGCAFLYTPKRNQHLVPGMPTSHYYVSPTDAPAKGPSLIPTDAPSNYVAVWESNGTQDQSNFLCIPAALEFRRWLGGEDRIMGYTTRLAQRGGEILSRRLGHGSTVMDLAPNRILTSSMVNVSLPLDLDSLRSAEAEAEAMPSLAFVASRFQTALADRYPTFVPFYVHADTIWFRVSAQVWLEESDFDWLADAILDTVQHLGWSLLAAEPSSSKTKTEANGVVDDQQSVEAKAA
ncbi:related to isopenicillin N epimerase [Pseudozyma flocculosa]|uniref:Related to isopenicillin N epimerase n=1 Tax=Pseudozyma flocculosa TaxID=84751 RepID=A0A5C3F574_9BASI|nr:related to isopenicillin N epimerase [Pseudozyma flocculosa]